MYTFTYLFLQRQKKKTTKNIVKFKVSDWCQNVDPHFFPES